MRKTLFALIAMAALPMAANAGDISYDYIELGYSQIDLDGTSNDFDGAAFNGSVSIGKDFFLYGGYGQHESDRGSIDLDTTRLGIGWHRGINDSTDLVLSANYLRFDVDLAGLSGDADGYEAEVGVRSAFTPNFEAEFALGYADGGDFHGDVYGRIQGNYKFSGNWGLVASATFAEGGNQYLIGPRLRF